LLFIILSQMTTGPSYERVFNRLKAAFPSWDRLLAVSPKAVRRLIADAGLANQKSQRISELAHRLWEDFGAVTLAPVCTWEDWKVEAYLTSLPGAGTKTAKCVMMYAMRRKVLPVDTHVARILRRLGVLSEGVGGSGVHAAVEAVVAPEIRYDLHVNAVAHGRAVCKARDPKCSVCVLRKLCRYGRSRNTK
jgi:endonuclease III